MRGRSIYTLLFSLLIIFSLSSNLYGQEKDFNLWTGVELEKEIINNFKLGLELNNRLKDNLNQRDESLIDIGLNYDVSDLTLSLVYRMSNRNEGPNNYSIANRFTAGMSYKYDFDRFRADFRAKYQNQYEEWHSSENGYIPEKYLRTRLKIRYNIRGIPIDPFVSYEAFLGADSYNTMINEKQRISIGIKYKFLNNNSLDIAFHKQNEKNITNPSDKSIISISYGIEL